MPPVCATRTPERWTRPPKDRGHSTSPIESSPAVVGHVAYVGSNDHQLYAFDASGTAKCLGTPKTCMPLWTALTNQQLRSSPAVANGIVYAASWDGTVFAFDATGSTKCSGAPKTCLPLWTAAAGSGLLWSSPAIANGVLYIGGADQRLYAFGAAGTINCSTTTTPTCTPLAAAYIASGASYLYSSPAVANGFVYIGGPDGFVHAFHT